MPVGDETTSTLEIEVEGSPLSAELAVRLEQARVEDSAVMPDSFLLRFGDPTADFFDKSGIAVGKKIRLSVRQSGAGGTHPLLSGEITTVEREVDATGMRAIVRGFDESHRLVRSRNFAGYRDSTAGDIARKVAQRASLQIGNVESSGPVLEYVTQSGDSDWSFLSALGADAGLLPAVHDGKVDFAKPSRANEAPPDGAAASDDPLVIQKGANILHLRATVTSAGQVPEVEVRGWSPRDKKELVATAPASSSSATLDTANPKKLADAVGSTKLVWGGAPFREQAQFDAAAHALAAHVAGGFAELDATVKGNPAIGAGAAIVLKGVGVPFDGQYVVTASQHEFDRDAGYTTSFTVSDASDRSLFGVTSGAGTGASGGGSMPPVVSALVTATDDPQQLGRVKVSIPSIAEGYESWWARVVMQGAGKDRGLTILPEVGDEVLIAFEGGDVNWPVIIGGLYNGKDAPKPGWGDHVASSDGAIIRRGLTSRTGMTVEVLESPNGELVRMTSNTGKQHVTLKQGPSSGIDVESDGPLSVKTTQDATIEAPQGTLKLSASKIEIVASTELKLSGATLNAAASGAAKLTGTSVSVAGDATAELKGGASTTVTGGTVRIN